MDTNLDTTGLTLNDLEKIKEALRITKYVHKYISHEPYHKDDMPYRIITDAARWYKHLDKENKPRKTPFDYGLLVAKIGLIEHEIASVAQDVDLPKKSEPDVDEYVEQLAVNGDLPTEIAAGNMRGIMYRFMELKQEHIIEIEVPETSKPNGKISKAVVHWYGNVDNGFSMLSNFTKWLFDRL